MQFAYIILALLSFFNITSGFPTDANPGARDTLASSPQDAVAKSVNTTEVTDMSITGTTAHDSTCGSYTPFTGHPKPPAVPTFKYYCINVNVGEYMIWFKNDRCGLCMVFVQRDCGGKDVDWQFGPRPAFINSVVEAQSYYCY